MTLTALILAGGASQRMGQDKALLMHKGVSLLRHTWDMAQTVTADVRVVTPQRDRYRPLLPPTAQWVIEPSPPAGTPTTGPLIAFVRALETIETEWTLLLACDLPNLQGSVLQEWQQALPQLPPTAIAYLPRRPQGWEPLCGFYRSACLPSLQQYLTTGRRSFQGWLDQPSGGSQSVRPIADVPVDMLANCNTPQDWQRWQSS
ncbi:MAG: molybdenum cofactor guanylyltransferase [Cyanobacteria bacterium P01_E01_bin.43]